MNKISQGKFMKTIILCVIVRLGGVMISKSVILINSIYRVVNYIVRMGEISRNADITKIHSYSYYCSLLVYTVICKILYINRKGVMITCEL